MESGRVSSDVNDDKLSRGVSTSCSILLVTSRTQVVTTMPPARSIMLTNTVMIVSNLGKLFHLAPPFHRAGVMYEWDTPPFPRGTNLIKSRGALLASQVCRE